MGPLAPLEAMIASDMEVRHDVEYLFPTGAKTASALENHYSVRGVRPALPQETAAIAVLHTSLQVSGLAAREEADSCLDAMLKPYYDHAGITIYHGNCRDVMEDLRTHWGEKPFDLMLTDPPYGLGKDGQTETIGGHGGRKAYKFLGWDADPTDNALLLALCLLSRQQIIWGGNYFRLPPHSKWLVWDKGQRINQSDGELAWTNMSGALRTFTLMTDGAVHPTQKPEALLQWCIAEADNPREVFDPFMGSGSTLIAAKRLGKRSVGIEREECYCEVAAERLQQDVLPFAEIIDTIQQQSLFSA